MLAVIPLSATVIAAAIAGAPTLVGFFVWHWISIAAVWGVLIEGAIAFPIAVAGIAWAWRVARHAGIDGPWNGIAFGALFASGVLVAEAIGLARGRTPSPMTGGEIWNEVVLAAIPVVLIALVGWRLTGTWQGVASFALAALPLDLHLGGTVMHLGGTGIALSLSVVLVSTYVLAGVILAALERRIAARLGTPPAEVSRRLFT